MLVRVCPRCRSEFQPHVTVCIDCGGPTEERVLSEDVEEPAEELEPEEDEEYDDEEDEDGEPEPAIPRDVPVMLVREASLDWIQELAAALDERGIPARIEPGSKARGGTTLILVVRLEDAEAAAEVDRAIYRSHLNEEELAPLGDGAAGSCPACGTEIPADASECPECGLVVAGEVEEGEEEGAAG